MRLKLFALIALLTKSNPLSSEDCSFLGTPDPILDKCNCEAGWIGPKCEQLNITTVSELPSSYATAIYTPDFSTWGGSVLKIANKYYAFVSSIHNGMQCWAYTSGCSIMQANNLTGPWELVSHIPFGDFESGYKQENVPWCHNFMATIEYKLANASDPNSKKTYAFVGYGIMKHANSNDQIGLVNFGPRTNKICTANGWAIGFPVTTQNQKLYAVYKELAANNIADIERELVTLLQARKFKTRINGYNYDGYISTGLKWLRIADRVPNVPLNAVNPAPLISYKTNQGALVKKDSGEYHRVLSFRYTKSGHEVIGLLGLKADKFIWDTGAKYYRGPTIATGWNIEDPFFFESKNGYHLIVHDGRVCGNWNACGSIMHHVKDQNNNDDLLSSASGWTSPTMLYNKKIDNLRTSLSYRHRPSVFFNDSAPQALLNSAIWPTSFKKSSTYIALVQH